MTTSQGAGASASVGLTPPAQVRPAAETPAGGLVAAWWHGAALFGLAVLGATVPFAIGLAGDGLASFWLSPSAIAPGREPFVRVLEVLAVIGLAPIVVPWPLGAARRLASLTRKLLGAWCSTEVPEPYLNPARGAGRGGWPRLRALLAEPATWRDLLWLVLAPCVAWALFLPLAMPMALLVYASVMPPHKPYLLVTGILLLASVGAMAGARRLLRAYGRVARSLLAPTAQAQLSLRVRHLAETRSESIDAGAAELRRIERDLHDGAQARLVAVGMTLSALEQYLPDDQLHARALLREAQSSSSKALAELRDLVRGIHPPVLADRGLVDAVRALALDSPRPVHVGHQLPGRVPLPVESAVYFAVSELLANVAKHSGEARAWVDIRYGGGTLSVVVADDGRGGARPGRGTGLRGIERRLAAFDGLMRLSSPEGGPTVVTLEVPCELSLPKTSSS